MIYLKKFLIISPNLEPIQCGVSDYVNILKELLVQKGDDVFCLSLNDHYNIDNTDTATSNRIHQSNSTSFKINKLRFVIKNYKPDYIYFNYVSYGYNEKGVPFWLLDIARLLVSSKIPVLIYFHELWIGQYKHESLKSKFLGFFQKYIILRFISLINPIKVFTNTDIFTDVLLQNKISAKTIPVFNNISVQDNLTNSTFNFRKQYSSSTLFFCFFGTIFPNNEFDKLYNLISKQQKDKNLDIVMLSIGNQKSSGTNWDKLLTLSNKKIEFIHLGILPISDISYILQLSDYAVTTYPIEFWSKSGSIAAMLAHNLKVFAIGSTVTDKLIKYRSNIPNNLILLDKTTEFIDFKKKEIKSIDNKEYNIKIFKSLYSNFG